MCGTTHSAINIHDTLVLWQGKLCRAEGCTTHARYMRRDGRRRRYCRKHAALDKTPRVVDVCAQPHDVEAAQCAHEKSQTPWHEASGSQSGLAKASCKLGEAVKQTPAYTCCNNASQQGSRQCNGLHKAADKETQRGDAGASRPCEVHVEGNTAAEDAAPNEADGRSCVYPSQRCQHLEGCMRQVCMC
jgi:hypothetical protein